MRNIVILTIRSLGLDRVGSRRLRLSLFVDGVDLEPIEVTWLEILHRGGRGGRGDLASGDPLVAVEVHQTEEIAQDRGATIVLRRHPTKLNVLSADLGLEL